MTAASPGIYLVYALGAAGLCVLFTGMFVSNRAVMKMANVLNLRYRRKAYRWVDTLGFGSNMILREYVFGPETKRLRRGYVLTGFGVALMVVAGLIRKMIESR